MPGGYFGLDRSTAVEYREELCRDGTERALLSTRLTDGFQGARLIACCTIKLDEVFFAHRTSASFV